MNLRFLGSIMFVKVAACLVCGCQSRPSGKESQPLQQSSSPSSSVSAPADPKQRRADDLGKQERAVDSELALQKGCELVTDLVGVLVAKRDPPDPEKALVLFQEKLTSRSAALEAARKALTDDTKADAGAGSSADLSGTCDLEGLMIGDAPIVCGQIARTGSKPISASDQKLCDAYLVGMGLPPVGAALVIQPFKVVPTGTDGKVIPLTLKTTGEIVAGTRSGHIDGAVIEDWRSLGGGYVAVDGTLLWAGKHGVVKAKFDAGDALVSEGSSGPETLSIADDGKVTIARGKESLKPPIKVDGFQPAARRTAAALVWLSMQP